MEKLKTTRQLDRATAAQRMQMVEQFKRSGLTRRAFSRQHGVPISTLNWWLTKTRRASKLPVPMMFSEVRVAPLPVSSAVAPWAMELVSRDGLTVRCREALSLQELDELLRGSRC